MSAAIEVENVIVSQKIQYLLELTTHKVVEPFQPNVGHNKSVNCTCDGNRLWVRCVQECEIHK